MQNIFEIRTLDRGFGYYELHHLLLLKMAW